MMTMKKRLDDANAQNAELREENARLKSELKEVMERQIEMFGGSFLDSALYVQMQQELSLLRTRLAAARKEVEHWEKQYAELMIQHNKKMAARVRAKPSARDRDAEIAGLVRQIEELEQQLETMDTMLQHLRQGEEGTPAPGSWKRTTEAVRDKMTTLRKQGYSYSLIAFITGYSTSTVQHYCSGIKADDRQRREFKKQRDRRNM